MVVVGIFAGMALFLSAVGIFGVISFSVTQRTREIGIRMALRAQSHHVTKLVLTEALRMTIAGLAIGTIVTLAVGRFLASLLYEVRPYDPLTAAAAALVMTVVAILAAYGPARRAVEIAPVKALWHE